VVYAGLARGQQRAPPLYEFDHVGLFFSHCRPPWGGS
jgi:hypothetical protein